MINNNVAILDSSSLVALLKGDDADHPKVARIQEQLEERGWRVVLPSEVLAETLNLLGKKMGRAATVTIAQGVAVRINNGEVALKPSELSVFDRATDLLKTATGSPSFIDCLVMAQADACKTPYIFGFDAAFTKNGYLIPDEAVPPAAPKAAA